MDVSAIIEQVVAELVPGGELTASQQLVGGSSASAHRLDLRPADGENQTVVLRVHRAVDFKGRDKDVAANEFHVLAALHSKGLRVPRPRIHDTAARWLVVDWIEGDTSVPSGGLGLALDQMAEFLAELHRLDPAGFDHRLPQLEDPRSGVLPYLPATPVGDSVRSTLTDTSLDLTRNPDVLIHGDYWPGNVLWRDGQLMAVIDWEDAQRGDPLADLASARVELLCAYGEAAMRQFTDAYVTRSVGLRLDSVAIWEIYVSASALATMHHWGLEPAEESRRRIMTEQFFEQAATHLVG